MSEKTLAPTPEQIAQFSEFPDDQSLMMMNFVKYREHTADTHVSGKVAYENYLQKALPFTKQVGAEVIWYGKPLYNLIAPEDEVIWDAVFVVKYPDKFKFFEMSAIPEFPHHLRIAALEDSRLIACSPQDNLFI